MPFGQQYVGLMCVEMPEARFEDLLVLQPNGGYVIITKLSREFLAVCEPQSIIISGVVTPYDQPVDVELDGDRLLVTAQPLPGETIRSTLSRPVVVRLSGVRRGHGNRRFPRFTEEEAAANSRFWDSWRK